MQVGCADVVKDDRRLTAVGTIPDDHRQLTTTTGVAGLNGWQCAPHSINIECLPGYVMKGVCTSGRTADCMDFCDPDAWTGIPCEPAPATALVGTGTWSAPFGFGGFSSNEFYECGENEYACQAKLPTAMVVMPASSAAQLHPSPLTLWDGGHTCAP
ncbi:expressed unknown protein [Seminavis robusta]|uniref:Uncharacterized protein n=1 Tax=Seminavis robusta TaxID=568900 RepID=A0A9N8F4W5_9STRA|nr:expressed unknown protein [Seminavis robusta]|eukprot:Sro3026_g342340.1 n/a (157) ;mRNA; r:1616-2086